MANMKWKSKYRLINDDFEIDELLDEIEDKQAEQMELLNVKEVEIDQLVQEKEKLESLVSQQANEISRLKNEISNLRSMMMSNERIFKEKMDAKVSEMFAIMNIQKKIDEQDREIEELERITEEQMEQFEELENNN